MKKTFTKLFPNAESPARNDITKDKYDIEWYAFIGYCFEQSLIITYPIVKLLYPDIQLKLYIRRDHSVIVNHHFNMDNRGYTYYSRDLNKPLIFDPISLTLNLDVTFVYSEMKIAPEPELIDEMNFSEYWCINLLNGKYHKSLDLIADIA